MPCFVISYQYEMAIQKVQNVQNFSTNLDGIILGFSAACKESMSDSLGLVDFVSRLVNSVFPLPDGQVMFFEEFE